ncbi:MAG TPA: DUF1707 domain-containing protein, partial [Longimicrobiales bacterium]|nr:DUF1707 domain-containing protein [Longimicrobiales bacterium]
MTETTPTLQAAREQAIDALCREYAADGLSMPELERRLERAREARTRGELRALLADLNRGAVAPAPSSPKRPAAGGGTRVSERSGDGVSDEIRRGSHLAFAIMGGTRRAGRWAPP